MRLVITCSCGATLSATAEGKDDWCDGASAMAMSWMEEHECEPFSADGYASRETTVTLKPAE